MKIMTTKEKESVKFIFGTSNYNVNTVKGWLERSLEEEKDRLLTLSGEELVKQTGYCLAIRDILASINVEG